MNHRPNFVYYDNPECTLYSGYCIKYDGDVKKLLLQLNSEQIQEFVSASSRDLASIAAQGVCAGAQVRGGLPPNAYTDYGISSTAI
jgi:hypothetical protein